MAATTAELRIELARVLGRGVAAVRRSRYPYQASYQLERLDVEFDDGGRMALLFKDIADDALSAAGRRAKALNLRHPEREIGAYRHVAGVGGIGAPQYYGAVVEPSRNRYWLFIELVSGTELWQVGDPRVWSEVARALARMHDTMCARASEVAARVPLIRYGPDLFGTWVRDGLVAAPDLIELEGAGRQAVERLAALPSTCVHGDLYPSNVLITGSTNGRRAVAVDWEMAGTGSGLLDLAALITGWPSAERRMFADAYRSALVTPPAQEEFEQALACCHLVLALRWLSRSRAWTPPPHHAYDWRSEALAVAQALRP